MKQILITFCLLFFLSIAFGQTDNRGFSFQGYAIDPDGKALAGTQVTVKFTVYSSSVTFTEEHTTSTDAFGVFHAIVGNSSTAKNDEFSTIDFTKVGANFSLKVEVRKTSGGSYTTISDQPMNAVPYARYAANGVPVGTIVAYGGDDINKIPDGWLLCDGASVLKTDFPQLYNIIGDAWGTSGASFNLPDLRGRFLRGVDMGQGRDPDAASRTVSNPGGNTGDVAGTLQNDTMQSHNHTIHDPGHTHSPASSTYNRVLKVDGAGTLEDADNTQSEPNLWSQQVLSLTHATTNIKLDPAGGQETRPVNAAVYYIIKY